MHRRAVSAAAGDGVDAVLFVLVLVALGKKKDVEKERDDDDDDDDEVATTCNPKENDGDERAISCESLPPSSQSSSSSSADVQPKDNLTLTAEEAIRNAPPAPADAKKTKRATNGFGKKTNKDWQIDFCSRPLKDDRGKKVWELLITDEDRSFEHAEFFPNNRINSVELAKALQKVVAKRTEETGEPPRKVKFFRSQMMTIITRACKECELESLPSRRCQTMLSWLEERMETVYKKHPGYDPNAAPLMTL